MQYNKKTRGRQGCYGFQFLGTEVAPIPAIGVPLPLVPATLRLCRRDQARRNSESCPKTENLRFVEMIISKTKNLRWEYVGNV